MPNHQPSTDIHVCMCFP